MPSESFPPKMLDTYKEILRAYSTDDLQKVHEITNSIASITDENRLLGEFWIYRGIAYGSLSNLDFPHISEMVDCIKNGVKLGAQDFTANQIAIFIATVINKQNAEFLGFFHKVIQGIKSGEPRTRIHYIPAKNTTVSESIGAGLGAGLAAGIINGMEKSKDIERQALQFELTYQRSFQVPITNGLLFSWSLDQTGQVAILTNDTISKVLSMPYFTQQLKISFARQLEPLLGDLKRLYPSLTRPSF